MPRKRKSVSKKPRKGSPASIAPSPSWTIEKGVSYSLLSRFINCRERFRLYTVEGVREEHGGKESMHFGTYFHELLELYALHPRLSATGIIRKSKKGSLLTKDTKDIANLIFEMYVLNYGECNYEYVLAEQEFKVPYKLPNGHTINLVGKTDEVLKSPDNDGTLWVQENKTKEKINAEKIESGIYFDIQSLMYCICMEKLLKRPVTGIVYNIIRKPSYSNKAVKMNKPELEEWVKKHPKSKAKNRTETQAETLERLRDDIEKTPGHFFMRWELPLPPGHIVKWRTEVFDPLLMQLWMWWESIKHDPFSPWTTAAKNVGVTEAAFGPDKMIPNPHHWLKPFGVYDPLTTGKGDFFNLITRNNKVGLTYGNPPFAELETIS